MRVTCSPHSSWLVGHLLNLNSSVCVGVRSYEDPGWAGHPLAGYWKAVPQIDHSGLSPPVSVSCEFGQEWMSVPLQSHFLLLNLVAESVHSHWLCQVKQVLKRGTCATNVKYLWNYFCICEVLTSIVRILGKSLKEPGTNHFHDARIIEYFDISQVLVM